MKFRKKKLLAKFPLTKTLVSAKRGVYGLEYEDDEEIPLPPIIY